MTDATSPVSPRTGWRDTWRRGMSVGVQFMIPSSVFILLPIASFWRSAPGPWAVVFTLVGLAFVVGFIGAAFLTTARAAIRGAWWAGLVVAVAALAAMASAPDLAGYFAAYLTVPAALLFRRRLATALTVAVAIVGAATVWSSQEMMAGGLTFMGLTLGLSIAAGLDSQRVRQDLAAAQTRNAVLAVAAERDRIGRDLHDILGHNLTALAVKTELASKLLDVDGPAARAQLTEVQALARQTLADVRATASGMRQVRLATELASARSVLEAAGVVLESPSAEPPLTDERAELFGWALREAVTNVVRHAAATRVVVTVTPDRLTVRDDGRGISGAEGSGLTGLRARAAAHGFVVHVQSEGRGTTVRLEEER